MKASEVCNYLNAYGKFIMILPNDDGSLNLSIVDDMVDYSEDTKVYANEEIETAIQEAIKR